jgi:hypothetical protein
MKRLARKADRSVRTFLRFVAVVAALVGVVVYWNFGTFSPCGVLREAIRQRGDLVAIFPDGVIDFAFEAQFGEMSAKRCFVVLLEAVTLPVPTTGQASQLSTVSRLSDHGAIKPNDRRAMPGVLPPTK